jgi:hypothetical protein
MVNSQPPMTPEEKAKLDAICGQIAVEKDPQTFQQLLVHLNDLLERKEQRLKESNPRQNQGIF